MKAPVTPAKAGAQALLRATLFVLSACASVAGAQDRPLKSGIDRTSADPSVRIQDDAYRAVNGHWQDSFEIPPDRSGYGTTSRIYDATQLNLRGLIETAARERGPTADARKVGDLFASFMDEARAEALGLQPVAADLARIDAMRTSGDVVAQFAQLNRLGVNAPLLVNVHQDAKDATRYAVDLYQGGIGLPNRDYFLAKDDARFAEVRAKCRVYLAKLLSMAGDREADASATAVVDVEHAIADAQWDEVANRDPVKTYNPLSMAELQAMAPHVDWARFVASAELAGRTRVIGLNQPSFVKAFGRILDGTSVATWKAYCKTRLLMTYAQYLNHDFVATRFAFANTTLRGTPEMPARWKRGVVLVEGSIGEGLGRLYVAKYFPAENKARIEGMVRNILAEYRASIANLDWMSESTREEALVKLSKFTPKIGYPDRWRDYTALVVRRDDLVGNVRRAALFEYRRNVAKLGKPIDRGEWGITPQTVNAYYNPELNEIVFAAGWLQPPYFDAGADDAANYGAIGAIIGHEISHGFDDWGSQYDGDGNLRNWWTDEDRQRFAEKTRALVAQYDAYVAVEDYHVNGALTLGENIADNAGLAVAFKGYHRSLAGKPAAVIDGLTGDERFYMGFVQAWQEKLRPPMAISYLKSDQHSPGRFRANGTLVNQAGFHETFGVKPGDRMYRPPEQRVTIW